MVNIKPISFELNYKVNDILHKKSTIFFDLTHKIAFNVLFIENNLEHNDLLFSIKSPKVKYLIERILDNDNQISLLCYLKE